MIEGHPLLNVRRLIVSVRWFIVAAGLLGATQAFAQANDRQSAQNVADWDIFLKLYPPRALAAHEEGLVGFAVTLDSQGNVTRCQVTHSSGHPILDEETCKLVTMHALFKPDPQLSRSQTKTSEGVINWKLPASFRSNTASQPVETNQTPEQVVCKKTVRIGTLAGFERTCMTPSEWTKQSDEQKQTYDELQGRKGSSRCDMAGGSC